MTIVGLDHHSRVALGRKIEAQRNARGLTLEQLAAKAGHEIKTVRNLIAGRKVHGSTRANVCKVLGIECEDIRLCESSDEDHGSYAVNNFNDYVGYFYAYRWSLQQSNKISRYVIEVTWDNDKKCLHFQEYQRWCSAGDNLDELRDHSQSGDVYFSTEIGLLHFLTIYRGAVRLITVSKFRLDNSDDLTMQGVVLTQAKRPLHYQPCSTPIILKKLKAKPSEVELNTATLIGPHDDDYERLYRALVDVENNVVKFALAPDSSEILNETVLRPLREANSPQS